MRQAVELVRTGGLSINLASQQCSVPYSSLYGRVRKGRRDSPADWEGVNEAQINDAAAVSSSSSGGAGAGANGVSAASEYSFPSAALSSLALARPDVSVTIRPTPPQAS